MAMPSYPYRLSTVSLCVVTDLPVDAYCNMNWDTDVLLFITVYTVQSSIIGRVAVKRGLWDWNVPVSFALYDSCSWSWQHTNI